MASHHQIPRGVPFLLSLGFCKSLALKVELIRGLLRRGFARADVEALFRFLDWLITLPPGLEEQFDAEVRKLEEEPSMTFITGIERRALARGIA